MAAAGASREPSKMPVLPEIPESTPENGAVGPFPTPQELFKEVQRPANIFKQCGHEFCCFGISVPGNRGATIEPEFDEKKLEISGAKSVEELRSELAKFGMAIKCKKGKKPEQPNQDNILFCKMGSITLYGVADGHGPDGHWASHWAARVILRLLMSEVGGSGVAPSDETFARMFDLTHQSIKVAADTNRFDLQMSGSTLSVCVLDHGRKEVTAAWVGDSRCAVGKTGGAKGLSLTNDHKPEDRDEKARIRASGGEVVRLDGDVPHRVFVKGGEVPGLAMSRAVGDLVAHSVGVIHAPGVSRTQLEDNFVLCCSDGVWEFIDSPEGTEMVSKYGREKVVDATENLTVESRDRWIKEEEYVTDDISAICVYV